jgi:hypothetical protein
MKDIKTFIKIAAWVALIAVVVGGLVFAPAWWEYPSATVGAALIALYVAIFGVVLCSMVILDVAIDAKERGKMRYRKYDSIPNRDARCKGYIDLTPGGMRE